MLDTCNLHVLRKEEMEWSVFVVKLNPIEAVSKSKHMFTNLRLFFIFSCKGLFCWKLFYVSAVKKNTLLLGFEVNLGVSLSCMLSDTAL
jgi:hypothetical protein